MDTSPQGSISSAGRANILLNDSLRQRTLSQLDEALLLIDPWRKRAYVEALNVCPHLVQSESNPMHFLQFEKFNVWSAAERLVTYWERRLEFFQNRCFLPIDLSGQGALYPEEITRIKRGNCFITSSGTAFLYPDPSNLEEPTQKRVRRLFFIFQHFINLPSTDLSRDFTVSVILPGTPVRSRRTQEGNRLLYQIVQTAFPLRIIVHKVVFKTTPQAYLRTIFPRLLLQLGLWSNFLKIHYCASPTDAATKLAPHGISPSSLPVSFGGTLDLHLAFASFLVVNKLPLTPMALSGAMGMDNNEIIRVWSTLARQQEGNNMRMQLLGATMPTGVGVNHLPINVAIQTGRQEDALASDLYRLDEAAASLPDCDKQAYLQAKCRCPNLIQQESNPESLLRMEKSDVTKVAHTLAKYWKNRVTIFGDQAFLPLKLNGAMTDEDATTLSSGYLMVSGTDKWGRSILCLDPSKLGSHFSLKSRLRVLFYCLNIILENPTTGTDGFVFLLLVSGNSEQETFNNFLTNGRRLIADVFLESCSLRPTLTHVIYCQRDGQALIARISPLVIEAASCILNQNARFHSIAPGVDLIDKFDKLGISKKCMPLRVGGEMDGNQFLRQRRQVESTMGSNDVLSNDGPTLSSNEVANNGVTTTVAEMMKSLHENKSNEKATLMKAIGNHSDLVEKESAYASFVRFSNSNATEAANLLVRYWKTRKDVFGDRVFLPMNQTGDGTLDKRDLNALQSAFLMQLPCDSKGSAVVYCDGSKLKKSTRQSKLRCAFYIFSIIAENQTSQDEGCQVLYHLTEPAFDSAFATYLGIVLKSIPVKLKYFHLLSVQSNKNGGEPSEKLKELVNELSPSNEVVVEHTRASRGELADALSSYGLSKSVLPALLGGGWRFEEFIQWQELRIRHEWDLPISAGTRDMADKLCIPGNQVPSSELTESERCERKRRLNLVNARRKRERERVELEAKHERVAALNDENSRLKMESTRLEDLVQKALAAIPHCTE